MRRVTGQGAALAPDARRALLHGLDLLSARSQDDRDVGVAMIQMVLMQVRLPWDSLLVPATEHVRLAIQK